MPDETGERGQDAMKETRKFTAEFCGARKTFRATSKRTAEAMAINYFHERFKVQRLFRRGEIKIMERDA